MKNKEGFTLIELLVVVVIIGILAAIALPQYQIAVGRSKFATLKEFTRSLGEARNRYLLANSEYPKSVNDLDIDISIAGTPTSSGSWFKFSTTQNITCIVWTIDDFSSAAACSKNILGKSVHYYVQKDGHSAGECLVYTEDKKDKASQMCAKETGKKLGYNCKDNGGGQYCSYHY